MARSACSRRLAHDIATRTKSAEAAEATTERCSGPAQREAATGTLVLSGEERSKPLGSEAQHVTLGDDAHDFVSLIDDRQGADAFRQHAPRDIAHQVVGRGREHRRLHDVPHAGPLEKALLTRTRNQALIAAG